MSKEPPFYKYFSRSESDYIFSRGRISKKDTNPQSSCNVPEDFFKFAIEKEIILKKQDNLEFCSNARWTEEEVYELNDDYDLEFGENMLWLIGYEFENNDNKFVISRRRTLTSCEDNDNGIILSEDEKNDIEFRKPQIYKKFYQTEDDCEDSWFIRFMDRNLPETRLIFDITDEKLILDIEFNTDKKFDDNSKFSRNRIIFGAPGTGKSHRLNMEKEFFEGRYERVTFHPNYSYSQFVGTYKPVPELDKYDEPTGNITYEYVPGPFMRSYIKAKKSPDNDFLLLIEEINRANVTAVFGDIFQLLDRKNHESEFEIETSEDMRKFLKKEMEHEIKNNDFDYKKMRIPSNMYIWATMNSADQGVFPMDTAFKRRWDFEYIGINESVDDDYKKIMVKLSKNNDPIHWNELRTAINNKLSTKCNVNEDKLLGPYFISKEILDNRDNQNLVDEKEFIEAFRNKVLMYLFEDAGKHCKELFEGCDEEKRKKFSSILSEFEKNGEKIFGDKILELADKD